MTNLDPCPNCGQPPGDTRTLWAVRGGGRPALYACGADCWQELARAESRKQRCPGFECGARFEPRPNGRRPTFCSEPCRKRTDRALKRAIVAVARGGLPKRADDIARTLAEVEFLRGCWAGRSAEARQGRPFPQVTPARRELVDAAYTFARTLADRLTSAEQAEAREAAGRAEQQRADERERVLAGRRAADAKWRVEVLAGYEDDEEAEA